MYSPRKIIFWSLLLLLTLVGAAWAIAHYAGGYARFLELARSISAGQWIVLGIATSCFYLLDYARLYTLFALLGIRIPLGLGMRLTCVTYFVSTLTPTAELNIPAMIFMLRRYGVPAAETAAVAVVKTFYMTLWVGVFGVGTLLWQDQVRLPPLVADHVVALTAPALTLLLFFFCLALFPQPVLHWTAGRLQATPDGWGRQLLIGADRSVRAIARVGRSTQRAHFLSHAACIAFVLVYVFIGAALCEFVGVPWSAAGALTVFSNSLLVSYLAPVPGSIGVTELLTNYLIDPAMTERGMVVSTLLRTLCSYIVVLPGAVLLLNAVRAVGWDRLREQWKPKRR